MEIYDNWNEQKKSLAQQKKKVFWREREIWWCYVGINIGHEQNGGLKNFSRPVLILRKVGKDMFLGVPLTMKNRKNPWAIKISAENGFVLCDQVRSISACRLKRKISTLEKNIFQMIRKKTAELLNSASEPFGDSVG